MSPHGKRLWPEAARQDRDTGSCTLVKDGLSAATRAGRRNPADTPWQLVCCMLAQLFTSFRNERESAASAPHDHPARFISFRLQLASQESPSVSEGCQATNGNVNG